MVDNRVGPKGGPGNDVQDVGVSRVSGSGQGVRYDEAELCVLDLRPLFFHNEHLQKWPEQPRIAGCGFCAEGLSSMVQVLAPPAEEVRAVLLPGPGADEKGPGASAPDRWWSENGGEV